MKKNIQVLLFLCFSSMLSAQLVITEISYNPPESGTDSLEYIELFNETASDIDLTNYVIRDNNPHTIAGGIVPANGYAILAINPSAIMSALGVEAILIADIALSNGGEPISIEDPNGNVIDEVAYDDNEPWPTFEDGTDGAGATIELCNLSSDNNDGSNWGAATNDLGVMINNISFLGTPGAENTASCEFIPDHIVEVSSNMFTPADITIQVGESIRWANQGGMHNVNGTTGSYPDNPEGFTSGFPSSASWTFDFTFTIAGVYNYRCDPHFDFGMKGTVTVEGDNEPVIPTYDIGLINTINAEGVGDSIGTQCIIEGVVHGANLRPGGLQFAVIDDSGDGISLFSGGSLGYTYAEGDKISVTGLITQFNGLLQTEATAVELISSGNPLHEPTVVDRLDEDSESQLVRVLNLTITDAAEWLGDGSSFNVDFSTEFGEIITIRIDSDTEAATWVDPFFLDGTLVTITGIGGQFDNESPYLQGYQLLPRYLTDFTGSVGSKDILEASLEIYPNPVTNLLSITTDVKPDRVVCYDLLGKILLDEKYNSEIDVRTFPNGSYILVVIKDGASKAIQFIK